MREVGMLVLGLLTWLSGCSINSEKHETRVKSNYETSNEKYKIRVKSNYEAGVQMHERGNIPMAITFFEQGVAEGDPKSMFALGSYYHFGEGVEKDYAKARELFERSSAIGASESDAILGIIYREGQGVEPDKKRAVGYLQKAAFACSDEAQEILAQMFYEGEGVSQNRVEALAFLHVAAKATSNEKAKSGVSYVSRELSSQERAEALSRSREIEKSLRCRS